MMTEQEICDQLHDWYCEGIRARDTGARNPYPARTLRHMMHMLGWCYQDQRLAHMRASPAYKAEQQRLMPGCLLVD